MTSPLPRWLWLSLAVAVLLALAVRSQSPPPPSWSGAYSPWAPGAEHAEMP